MPGRRASRRIVLGVEFDNCERHRTEAGSARQTEPVDECEIAFRCPIEFADARDAKALLEIIPQLGAQTIADDEAHTVFAIAGLSRLIEPRSEEHTSELQ